MHSRAPALSQELEAAVQPVWTAQPGSCPASLSPHTLLLPHSTLLQPSSEHVEALQPGVMTWPRTSDNDTSITESNVAAKLGTTLRHDRGTSAVDLTVPSDDVDLVKPRS